MKHIYRLLIGGIAGLALTMSVGAAAVPALAATTLYVNDTTGNDPSSVHCPATPYNNFYSDGGISEAVAAAADGSTVIVCQGNYTIQTGSPVVNTVLMPHGFTLKTMGEVHVSPVAGYNSGALFILSYINKLNMTGFYIDGHEQWSAGDTYIAGIELYNTNATLTKNYIDTIGDNYADTNTEGYGIDVYGTDAYDSTGNFKPYTVTIKSNTINLAKWTGINVRGNVKPTISSNVIIMSGAHHLGPYGEVGLYLENFEGAYASCAHSPCKAIGGTVSGNTFIGDFNLTTSSSSGDFQTGIFSFDSSNDKFTGNKFSQMRNGIFLLDEYALSVDGSHCFDTQDNTISGNTGTAAYGVLMIGHQDGGTCSASMPYIFRNKLTGNKFTGSAPYGTIGLWADSEVGTALWVDFKGKTNTISGNTMLAYVIPYMLNSNIPSSSSNKSGPPVAGAAAAPAPTPGSLILPQHFNAPKPPLPGDWQSLTASIEAKVAQYPQGPRQ